MSIRYLSIDLQDIDKTDINFQNKIHVVSPIANVVLKYPEIFEEKVGCIPDIKVSLQLRENSEPVYSKERELPYSLREKVDAEIETLEAQEIISKVVHK